MENVSSFESIIEKLRLDKNNPGSFKVLIIDDDKWTSRIIIKFIEMCGFSAIYTQDPIDGIAIALKEKPFLILLDLLMPEVYGSVVLKILKRIEDTKDIPIVIISGNLDEKTLFETYKDGAAGFISKPFRRSVLIKKIEESLGFPLFHYYGIDLGKYADDLY